jgi:hypothetical protein
LAGYSMLSYPAIVQVVCKTETHLAQTTPIGWCRRVDEQGAGFI